METPAKNQNEGHKAKASTQRTDSISETRTSNEEQQRAETTNGKWNPLPPQKKPKLATKSIINSQFHSFASTLDLWKVVDIKSNEKPERTTTGNEKQQKATKSNKKQKRTSELEKLKRAIKNQNKKCDVQMETHVQSDPAL